jgi:hypothetical protein
MERMTRKMENSEKKKLSKVVTPAKKSYIDMEENFHIFLNMALDAGEYFLTAFTAW